VKKGHVNVTWPFSCCAQPDAALAARFTRNPESVSAAARRPFLKVAMTIAASLLASRRIDVAVGFASRFNSVAVMSSARTRQAGLNAAVQV